MAIETNSNWVFFSRENENEALIISIAIHCKLSIHCTQWSSPAEPFAIVPRVMCIENGVQSTNSTHTHTQTTTITMSVEPKLEKLKGKNCHWISSYHYLVWYKQPKKQHITRRMPSILFTTRCFSHILNVAVARTNAMEMSIRNMCQIENSTWYESVCFLCFLLLLACLLSGIGGISSKSMQRNRFTVAQTLYLLCTINTDQPIRCWKILLKLSTSRP